MRVARRGAPPPDAARVHHELAELQRFADTMDSAVRIPGTGVRIGLDGLLGLVPGIGDLLSALLSLSIVYRGWRLGASSVTAVRMLGNLALDAVVGAVPVAGDLFDFVYAANQRNMRLLRDDLERSQR